MIGKLSSSALSDVLTAAERSTGGAKKSPPCALLVECPLKSLNGGTYAGPFVLNNLLKKLGEEAAASAACSLA